MWLRAALLALAIFVSALAAEAIVLTISAIVEGDEPPTPADTVVIFRGIAYPGSTVTVQRDGVTLVEAPADPAARFDIELGNQTPGSFTYTVFATDDDGRVGNEMNFDLMLTEGATVTLTGIFLGPTIQINDNSFDIGDTITFIGQTAPDSEVTLTLTTDDGSETFTADADSNGLWTIQFLGSDIGAGDFTARAKARTPDAEISDFSNSLSFSVAGAPSPCTGRNQADLNCDGKVNLTDFSILLFFWRQTNPANERADINNDNVVNLTDLSILLFNWAP